MNIIPGYDSNLPTQLWIAARYLQGITFLIAPFFMNRKLNPNWIFSGYSLITAFLLASVFLTIFPDCYIEGRGLTGFKIISEYAISSIFLIAAINLFKYKKEFDSKVFIWLLYSILLMVGGEIAFTFYISVYGISNFIGHIFKLLAFILIFRAIIETGLAKPYQLVFRKLDENLKLLEVTNQDLNSLISERDKAIAKLETAEGNLAANEKRYRELFDNINSGVALYQAVDNGLDFIIKDLNIAGQKIDDISRADVLDRKVTEVFPGIKEMKLLDTMQRVWRTGKAEHHQVTPYKDERISGWRTNFVYKLPSGEIVVIYDDITERKSQEEILKASEERFHTLAQSASDGIVIIDGNGIATFINNKAEKLSGWTAKEMIGKPITQLMPGNFHKTHQEGISRVVNTGKTKFIGKVVEVIGKKKNGLEFPIELSLAKWKTSEGVFFTGIIRDITKRKEIEEKLNLDSQMLTNIIDGILLYKVDDGSIVFTNTQFEELFGYGPNELIGKHVSILNSSANEVSDQKIKEINESISVNGIWEGEIHNIKKDGRLFWSHASISMFNHTKHGDVFVSVQQNITDRKQLQLELTRTSTHDSLTGLYNRAFFDAELKRLQGGRHFPVSVVMADVNGLKNVNDTYGHAKGDLLLQRAANVLAESFRADDVVARIGGDEFAALLPDTDAETTKKVLGRIKSNIKKDNKGKDDFQLSISFGARTAEDGQDLMSMLKKADQDMYQEKKKGNKSMGNRS
jgi:diguanylate cyclase (GGDEF)-like protein/PAS domain S-box-containing protein